jgi:hypothetical protein
VKAGLQELLKKLLARFAVIRVWIPGLLLTAMIVFPGLIPSEVLGAPGQRTDLLSRICYKMFLPEFNSDGIFLLNKVITLRVRT